MDKISGTGCLTACVLLACMPASAGLHGGEWYPLYTLLRDLLLNHLFSSIHTLQLLYDLDSLSPQHRFVSSFYHLLIFQVCFRLGRPGTTLAFHKNGSDSSLSPQIPFSETIPVRKAGYRQDLASPSLTLNASLRRPLDITGTSFFGTFGREGKGDQCG